MTLREKSARFALATQAGMTSVKFIEIIHNFNNSAYSYLKKHNPDYLSVQNPAEKYIVYGEDAYPRLLKNISDPPPLLFYKGNPSLLNSLNMVSIVGTRANTLYGRRASRALVKNFVSKGFVIISGLARGIDTIVHEAVIELKGYTIAVIGTNINRPVPGSNESLYQSIINNNGLVISEFNKDVPYHKGIFPRRNRIIAGLCPKCIIVEAPKISGALITARYAFEYNREVFAVPGPVFSRYSSGCNKLIEKNIAAIITEISNSEKAEGEGNKDFALTDEEQKMLDQIETGDTMDKIILKSGSTGAKAFTLIAGLKFKNKIALDEKGQYTVL